MRVVFAGTPAFAAEALKAIAAAGHEVVGVLTQPDRPAGRGMKLQASAVKQVAQDLGVSVWQPLSLRLDGTAPDDARSAQSALQAAQPDVMVVAAYGLILPRWTLELPRWGCLNIHASLLPRWRGAAPIHRAIEAGDAETGITIMQMDEGLDTGDMLSIWPERISADDTTASLHDRLAALGAKAIVDVLTDLPAQGLTRRVQPDEGVTYAHKIDKTESAIDWTQPAAQIERRIRAFDPFPGCTMDWAGEVVKVWQARVIDAPEAPAGTVFDMGEGRLAIACGSHALELLQVQRPGGRRAPVSALAQGGLPQRV
jgi:methionyl-tRNA formyltransferase